MTTTTPAWIAEQFKAIVVVVVPKDALAQSTLKYIKTTSWAASLSLGAHTAFHQPRGQEQSLRPNKPGVPWTTPGTFSRMLSDFLEHARKATRVSCSGLGSVVRCDLCTDEVVASCMMA